MQYTQSDSLVFAYAKGSPMLAKYLEMNRVIGVQVWRSAGMDGKPTAVMLSAHGESGGFPEDARPSLKSARALAFAMAEHTGLPLIDEDEQSDKVVIHWSDGTQTVSRNLRGLVREFGKSLITSLVVNDKTLRVGFRQVRGNVWGFCETEFSDAWVLREWLTQRRNLRGVGCVIDGESGTIPFDYLV